MTTKKLEFGDAIYELQNNETVLACLLRANVNVPNSCQAGVCQSCLMHTDSTDLPSEAQKGLKAADKQRGLFLACQCKPISNIRVQTLSEVGLTVNATIAQKVFLNSSVLQIQLVPDAEFTCYPGQYLTLINTDSLARSYSIANNPNVDGFIEIHIKVLVDGLMSQWLNKASIGSIVSLAGPAGHCCYASQDSNGYPIVLAGTGTGLAPLYGIVKEALLQHHSGDVYLYHGTLHEDDLYLVDELQALDRQYANFHYHACVLNGNEKRQYLVGDIQEIVMDILEKLDLPKVQLFLCGDASMVNQLKTKAFLAGAASKNIFVDAFLPSKIE